MPQHYPLSAIVGSDDLILALVLAAIAPDIGGVLVRGEKGTAKTTAVRALADVLPPIEVIAGDRFSSDPSEPNPLSPDGPFPADAPTQTRPVRLVELPVGATEDRVLGSLHLQRVLTEGVTQYEPGLLARAHRGILYVDEVNLLHDHLVDVLLDAAATGRVSIERDGVSVEHAAAFVLVGTMNPEEGELRPQLLDRFGLTVEVAASRDPRVRAEVVRRRLAFDADPQAFIAEYLAADDHLRDRITAARSLADKVELDDATLVRIAEICAAFDVDGMRADIVTARAAAAHAAWHGRVRIETDDLRVAARFALPHRRRRNPFDSPGMDEDKLEQLLEQTEPDPDPDDPNPNPDDPDPQPDPQPPGDHAEVHDQDDPHPGDPGDPGEPPPAQADPTPPRDHAEVHDHDAADPAADADDHDQDRAVLHDHGRTMTAALGEAFRSRVFTVDGLGHGASGRRSRARTDTGRRVGARRPGEDGGTAGSLHLIETVRAAAPHQHDRGRDATTGGPISLAAQDLRLAVTEGTESNLVLFCVDASGSMAARQRMVAVKTAILSMLTDAYQRRDKVALVTFRADHADLVLPPTGSVEVAVARLRDLPAGGRTPLAEGLATVADVLRVERMRDPRRRPLLILVTDGRATYGADPLPRAHRAAAALGATGLASVVIDCESGRFRMGLAGVLAQALGAEHVPIEQVDAAALSGAASRLTAPARRGEVGVA